MDVRDLPHVYYRYVKNLDHLLTWQHEDANRNLGAVLLSGHAIAKGLQSVHNALRVFSLNGCKDY